MGTADPGAIVWDEVIAFWLVLWLVMPAGLMGQAAAFAPEPPAEVWIGTNVSVPRVRSPSALASMS